LSLYEGKVAKCAHIYTRRYARTGVQKNKGKGKRGRGKTKKGRGKKKKEEREEFRGVEERGY